MGVLIAVVRTQKFKKSAKKVQKNTKKCIWNAQIVNLGELKERH